MLHRLRLAFTMAPPAAAAAALCATLLAPASALAGPLSLTIVDGAGQPVKDAVVTVRPDAGIPAGPIRFPWGTQMVQQNITFVPHVLIVPVGATVSFPNRDRVRHHVYSFSRPARFELRLFGRDETRSYTFTTAGAVAIGCNIHDQMSAFIKVVDTPFAGLTNASGAVTINGMGAGGASVTIWHPRMRGRDNEMTLRVPLTGATVARRVAVQLR